MLDFFENVIFVFIGIFTVFLFTKLPEMERNAKAMRMYVHNVEIEAIVKNPKTKKNELHDFSLTVLLSYECTLDKLVQNGHILTEINGTKYLKLDKNNYISVEKFKDMSLSVEKNG